MKSVSLKMEYSEYTEYSVYVMFQIRISVLWGVQNPVGLHLFGTSNFIGPG